MQMKKETSGLLHILASGLCCIELCKVPRCYVQKITVQMLVHARYNVSVMGDTMHRLDAMPRCMRLAMQCARWLRARGIVREMHGISILLRGSRVI